MELRINVTYHKWGHGTQLYSSLISPVINGIMEVRIYLTYHKWGHRTQVYSGIIYLSQMGPSNSGILRYYLPITNGAIELRYTQVLSNLP